MNTGPGRDAGADSGKRIGALDGVRALAIGAIVLLHLLGISGYLSPDRDDTQSHLIWIAVGNTIDLFFVLSGFLLFLPVIRRGYLKGGTLHFYARRAARIQPEYWFCLLTVFLMIVLIPVDFPAPVPTVGEILIHVFDLQTIVRMFDSGFLIGFWIDGALWIIPVLVGLYLVFPPLARLMLKRVWLALALTLLVTLAWKLSLHYLPGFYSWLAGGEATHQQLLVIGVEQSPSFAFSFAVGMAAALLWQRASRPGFEWVRRWLPLACVVAFLVWLWSSNQFAEATVQSTTGMDTSSFGRSLVWENLAGTVARGVLVLAIGLAPWWLLRPLDNRFAAWSASLSFGVFMIHLPIAFFAGQLLSLPVDGQARTFLIWVAVVIPPSLLWAWFSRRLIGRPTIEWTERRLKEEAN